MGEYQGQQVETTNAAVGGAYSGEKIVISCAESNELQKYRKGHGSICGDKCIAGYDQ